MIRVEDLHRHFGGFRAVDGASLTIETGSITGLIGPNGAGKSTLFNVIAGVLPPTSGRVFMDGEDISGLPPHELFHKGLLRTFQLAHEFSSMTVRENLMMVPGAQSGETIWKTWFQRGRIEREEAELKRKADEVLDFLTIRHLTHEKAGNLSGGQKKRVFLARAIAQEAQVILLDEPFTGVDVQTEQAIIALLKAMRDEGRVMLVSTHDLGSVPEYCDRVVMVKGTVLAHGPTETTFTPENLRHAFGGVLRHFVLGGAALHDDADQRSLDVFTDDERPLVFYDQRARRKDE